MRSSGVRRMLRPIRRTLVRLREHFITKVLAPVMRTLPITSAVFGPPGGIYETTQAWYESTAARSAESGASVIHVADPIPIVRAPPGTIDSRVHENFKPGAIGRRDESYQSFVVVIPKGRVVGTAGAVITPDDRILLDLSMEFLPRLRHTLLGRWNLPAPEIVLGNSATIATAGSDNYYHWMVNELPRLHILQEAGFELHRFDRVVVSTCDRPFHHETLSALGVRAEQITSLTAHPHVLAETLTVPSLVGEPGNVPAWVCNFLRDTFLPTALDEDPKRRIYVSRADARLRTVTNERDVMAFLAGRGFEYVTLAGMSVADQAKLFASAAVVVAPHGAGLTNTIFCRRGTLVIELFSPLYVNGCYWTLCNHAHLDYYYLIGAGTDPSANGTSHVMDADITIDLAHLERLLHRMDVSP